MTPEQTAAYLEWAAHCEQWPPTPHQAFAAGLAQGRAEMQAERDALLEDLRVIANAPRFASVRFDDDTEFADWAQSRARAALEEPT